MRPLRVLLCLLALWACCALSQYKRHKKPVHIGDALLGQLGNHPEGSDEELNLLIRYCFSLAERKGQIAVLELATCELAVRAEPRNPVLLLTYAEVLQNLDRHEHALPYLRNAYRITRNREDLYSVCTAYLRAGHCDRSIACANRLLDTHAGARDLVTTYAHSLLGIALGTCGNADNRSATERFISNQMDAQSLSAAGCKGFTLVTEPSYSKTLVVYNAPSKPLSIDADAVALPSGVVERAHNAGVAKNIFYLLTPHHHHTTQRVLTV